MEKSESIKNIALALVKFDGLVGKIKKDSKNPFFKSNYAALPNILDAIHQPLLDCNLTVKQFPTGTNGLTTIVIHAESGEYMMDTYVMKPVKEDPQGLGSSITYQRRYALGAALGLNIDEDDDGNKASAKVAEVKPDTPQMPELLPLTEAWKLSLTFLIKDNGTIDRLKKRYRISKANEDLLLLQASESI